MARDPLHGDEEEEEDVDDDHHAEMKTDLGRFNVMYRDMHLPTRCL